MCNYSTAVAFIPILAEGYVANLDNNTFISIFGNSKTMRQHFVVTVTSEWQCLVNYN